MEQMKKYLQKNLLTSVSVLVIFLCFFHITYLTPMQCDDFWYYKIGLNPNKHINHYLHWSGRIIADYFSCALLQIPSHAVSSAIISFFATGICYFIVKIPTVVNPDYKVSWWKLMVTAALYWISNPQIEDSTFWVVGACNYVVTTFLVFMFLYFFLKNRNSFSWCLAILSIAAGCSNENTCLAIIYTLLVLLLISHFKKINSLTIDVKLNKKFFLIYSALFVIGALILILSPGNFERLQQGVCRNWCELFFDQKINQFIDNSQRNLSNMGRAWKFYILSLGMAAILWKKNQKQIAWSLLFFSTATVSYIVMAISPYFPGRALNSTLCFLLLAISFLADLSLLRYKTLKIILITTIAYVLWLFVKFFAILSVGHQSVMIQDAIRIDQKRKKRKTYYR